MCLFNRREAKPDGSDESCLGLTCEEYSRLQCRQSPVLHLEARRLPVNRSNAAPHPIYLVRKVKEGTQLQETIGQTNVCGVVQMDMRHWCEW